MIIRIQDRNVSTENILDIGEVIYHLTEGYLLIYYDVELINGKKYDINHKVPMDTFKGVNLAKTKFLKYVYSQTKNRTMPAQKEFVIKAKAGELNLDQTGRKLILALALKFYKDIFKVEVDKVKKVHQELLTLWNDNKSEIPTFKI